MGWLYVKCGLISESYLGLSHMVSDLINQNGPLEQFISESKVEMRAEEAERRAR